MNIYCHVYRNTLLLSTTYIPTFQVWMDTRKMQQKAYMSTREDIYVIVKKKKKKR